MPPTEPQAAKSLCACAVTAVTTTTNNKELEVPSTQLTQEQLNKAAVAQLRIIGGSQTKDEDIIYEGKQWRIPAKYTGNPEGAALELIAFVRYQQEEVMVQRTYDYLQFDGANAVYHCLKSQFGFAQSMPRKNRSGVQLPAEITIPVGFHNGKLVQINVPWGDFHIPSLEGAVVTTQVVMNADGNPVFQLVAKCRRCDEDAVNGFFFTVGEYLEENSIYRGKAMTGDMIFIDTDAIDPSKFVYTEQADWEIAVAILSPLRDLEAIRSTGMNTKRATLLEGAYGGGKSGMLATAMKVAVANQVTVFAARPGEDNPFQVLKIAAMYAGTRYRALVVIEDVDTFVTEADPLYVSRFLDAFDSARGKGCDLYLVMTTNHKEEIHKGMLRPGRLDAIIEIGAMDRAGVEKLTKLVVGQHLEGEIDYDAVYAATEGYMPAFVREGLERSLRAPIARTGKVGRITTDDLVKALTSLRPQYELHCAANDRKQKLPPLDAQFRRMFNEEVTPTLDGVREAVGDAVYDQLDNIQERVDQSIENRMGGARLVNMDGEERFEIQTN